MSKNASSPQPPSPTNDTTYYDLFTQHHGHTTEMLVIISIRAAVSSCGFISNWLLVLATIKSKRLKTFCNHLIALDCLCLAIFHLYSIITWFIVVISGQFIELKICFFAMLIPQFCINVEYGVMVQIGAERLANILFPIWSRNQKSKKIHMLILCIYIAFCIGLMAIQCWELFNEKSLVFCQMSDVSSRPGIFNSIASVRTLICRSAMIVIYASIIILVKVKKLGNNESFQRDIYKSVTAIMLIEIGFWIPSTIFNKIYLFFGLSSLQKTYLSAYLSCVNVFSGSISAPVLFFLSQNYRAAFKELRAFLPKCANLGRIKPIIGIWSSTTNQTPYQMP